MSELNEEIRLKIKQIMKNYKITWDDVVKNIDLSRPTFSKMLEGTVMVSLDVIERVCEKANIRTIDFFTDKYPEFPPEPTSKVEEDGIEYINFYPANYDELMDKVQQQIYEINRNLQKLKPKKRPKQNN